MKNNTIEQILKEYKIKKSKLEICKERVRAWEHAIINPDMIAGIITYTQEDDCWIRKFGSGSSKTMSIVENEILDKENETEYIKELIRYEQSKIFIMELEIVHVDKALESLSKREQYIIQLKYFDNLFWKDIEINYNKKFNESDYITAEGLRKISKKALKSLEEVLNNIILKVA